MPSPYLDSSLSFTEATALPLRYLRFTQYSSTPAALPAVLPLMPGKANPPSPPSDDRPSLDCADDSLPPRDFFRLLRSTAEADPATASRPTAMTKRRRFME